MIVAGVAMGGMAVGGGGMTGMDAMVTTVIIMSVLAMIAMVIMCTRRRFMGAMIPMLSYV